MNKISMEGVLPNSVHMLWKDIWKDIWWEKACIFVRKINKKTLKNILPCGKIWLRWNFVYLHSIMALISLLCQKVPGHLSCNSYFPALNQWSYNWRRLAGCFFFQCTQQIFTHCYFSESTCVHALIKNWTK